MPDDTSPREIHPHSALSTRVFGAIEHDHIRPHSSLHFLMREWVIWAVAALALVLGAMATALTIYIAGASQFIEESIERSSLDVWFQMVPMFWLLLIAIGIYYTAHAVRETKRGYRYNPGWVVSGALGLSIALGYAVHLAGASEYIDNRLLESVPLYQPLTAFKPAQWMKPNAGVLAGVIESVATDTIEIRSLDGDVHTITLTPDTNVLKPALMREGMPVRVEGTTTEPDGEIIFTARVVGPFMGRGGRMHAPGQPRHERQQVRNADTDGVKENNRPERTNERHSEE